MSTLTPEGSFNILKENVAQAISTYFPYEGKQRRLELHKVWVDDKLDTEDLKSQSDAKDQDRTWGVPVKADISLIDKVTGKTVDRKIMTLARLPKLTGRFGFIVDGSEYQVDHLFRLKSGVYARVQENGDLESEFNLVKGPAGNRFSIQLERESKRFFMKQGDAHIPLYPILKSMGVSDDDLEKDWGKEILHANRPKTEEKMFKSLQTFFKKTSQTDTVDPKDLGGYAKYVHDFFDKTVLLPETTKITLGRAVDKVDGQVLRIASNKILGVSRQTHLPDDRDSLAFKDIVSVEDFLPEKLERAAKTIKGKLRNTIDLKDKTSVSEVLSSDLFARPLREFFTKGGSLTERSDQTNPIQMMSGHRKTTLMAPDLGGIKKEHSITDDMRIINPSHFGFLDPMHTPECFVNSEVYTSTGWKKFEEVTLDDELLCAPFGLDHHTDFRKPERLIANPYKGKLYGMDNGKISYLVTPNHRVVCRPYSAPGESKLRFDLAESVHARPRMFPVAHRPVRRGDSIAEFEFRLPWVSDCANNILEPIPMELWAEFMGWFLSEGSFHKDSTIISQSREVNPEKYERISVLLSKLPFGKWCEPAAGLDFRKGHKQLASYLSQFGDCSEKFIPEYIFRSSIEARELFIEAMLLGDGRTFSNRKTDSKVKSYKQKVYTTTSLRLASDFERLATEMGYSVSTKSYADKREERYLDVYEVRLLKHKESVALPQSHINVKRGKTEFLNHYYTKDYDGMVYCATVPGGMLFVRQPGRLGMWTGNSERTGITLHLGMATRKNGKSLEAPAYDIKTAKVQYLSAPAFHNTTMVLPDQVRWEKGKPVPISQMVKMKMPGGAIESHLFHTADYVMPSAKGMFDVASNLIPFLPSNQGNRVSMADKQMEQAISLKFRDAPLVQSKTDHSDPSVTFEKVLGGFTSHRASIAGKISDIKNDSITISDGKKKHHVHLYNHFPLNDPKGMMHSEAIVRIGDTVKAGQVIADNNFTKQGVLSLGANLRVGYIPYKGYNYEDGIVISDSAAKKFTSEHLYKKRLELDPELDVISKPKFIAFAATKSNQLTKEQLDLLDEDGVVRVGSKVGPGQVLIAAVGKNLASRQGSALAALGKRAFQAYKDKSLVWDEDHVGEVVKVIKNPMGRGAKVYIKTEEQMQVGDKISGRHGNKGIVTMILPDHEMPFTKDEKGERRHLEVLLNPTGVPTRINVGQVMETAAAKIAEKTGKTYIVNNFSEPSHDYRQQVLDDLKKNGLSDEELVYDPKNPSKALGSVLVGPQHLLKLKHQVEKKLTVRGGGTDLNGKGLPYDIDKQPSKGGEKGGQGFGALDLYAMLGHDARHNLREMATYKSDYQDSTFWNMVQEGHEPPPPKVPFSYQKFVGLLNGLGVNVEKKGTAMQLMPMTDKQIINIAGGPKGELKNSHLALRAKDLKEEKGGLFDPIVTGGLSGNKWGFVKLTEPMPNPIFVGSNNRPGPIPTLLGLKLKELDEVMKGTRQLNGKIGGIAIFDALKKLDVKQETEEIRKKLPILKGADLDRSNKKLKYLIALRDLELKPHEAYVLHNIPVLPPAFRPATITAKGDIQYSSLNGLYKNLSILNNKLSEVDPKIFSEEHKGPIRWQLFDSLKALQSIGGSVGFDADSPGSRRKLKGILDIIGGGDEEQPKEGFFQSKLVKRRLNLSIRSTIVPEPSLGIDEVGIPKGAAMELYKPFVVAELAKHGFDPLSAQKEMRSGSASAYSALERVVKDRPMLLKRDPALHKFSIMAFTPKLVEGKAIQIHPLVTGGYNADFDGDEILSNVFLVLENGIESFLTSIVDDASISVEWKDPQWWAQRKIGESMAARFKETVSFFKDGDIYACDLEDFPRFSEHITKKHIDYHAVPKGVQVIAYNESVGTFALAEVSNWSFHKQREIEIVNLRSGRQIITDDDPRAVYGLNQDLEVSRFRPKDAVGSYVPVSKILDIENEATTSLQLPKEDPRLLGSVELDLRFGYLLGILIGDGWISDDRQVCLAAADDGVRDAFIESLLSVFREPPTITETTRIGGDFGPDVVSRRFVVSSSALAKFIEPLIGKKAENKHLPPFFLTANKNFQFGLLSGLIDTDGSISVSHGKDKPQWMSSFSSTSLRLVREVVYLSKSLGMRASITSTKTPKGNDSWTLTFSTVDLHKLEALSIRHSVKRPLFNQFITEASPEIKNSYAQIDIVPTPTAFAKWLRDLIGTKLGNSLYVVLSNAMKRGYISRYSAKELLSKLQGTKIENPTFSRWVRLVHGEHVQWDVVESFEKTGILEDGYDLTVPGFETFMSIDGTVLSNTMAGTVPLSREAVEEAKKMFPSKNLFSPTTGDVMYAPSQDSMLGLHLISRWGKKVGKSFASPIEVNRAIEKGDLLPSDVIKVGGKETTFGRILIESRLPRDFHLKKEILHDPNFLIDKKSLNKQIIVPLAKIHTREFSKVVDDLKDLGNEYAFKLGFSFGLKDLAVLPERKKILGDAKKEETTARGSITNKEDLNAKIIDIYQRATEAIEVATKKMPQENRLATMVSSGARGKPEQLRQMIAAPMLVQDSHNNIIPTPILKSYGEGLDVGDYWLAQHGARKGTLQRVLGTEIPGVVSKDIINSTISTVITSNDCKTTQGLLMELGHRDLHDRYTAKAYKLKDGTDIKSGTLLTPEITSRLRNSKIDKLLVRSPLKCQHGNGICAKCFGLNESGKLHDAGTNIGVLAGQALSEPAVQMAMDAFHTGGVATGRGALSVDRLTRLRNALSMPKKLKNSATLARIGGTVTSIKKDAVGGVDIFIGTEKHFIPKHLISEGMAVGSEVRKGQALSEGFINPHHLLPLTDIHAVQNFLTNELYGGLYEKEGVRRRNVEVAVRALTNLTKIRDPGHGEFYNGDIVSHSVVEEHNRNLPKGKHPTTHDPILRGIAQTPLTGTTDWMARMNYRELHSTVQQGAAQGWKSDIHGTHPIPGLAYGAEFGKAPPTKPKHNY